MLFLEIVLLLLALLFFVSMDAYAAGCEKI
jgi:hypothetical protein